MKKASSRPMGFMRPARLERKTQAKGMDKAARQNHGRKAGDVHFKRNKFIGGCMRSVEDLQYKGLKLIQEDNLFRFGTDAVLLASFCEVKKRDIVVDLGTGTGIIPILLSARTGCRVIGVEIQKACADLARENAEINGLKDRIEIIHADLRQMHLEERAVSAVVCNPPYEKVGSGKVSVSDEIRIARHEVCCTMQDAVTAASRLLGTGGKLFMIHRAPRAAELIYTMHEQRIEAKILRPIQARAEADPRYVLVMGIKDGSPGLKLKKPLLIYDENGSYTQEMNQIYHIGGDR